MNGTILDQIVATKRREIEAARAAKPEAELRQAVRRAASPLDFLAAVRGPGPIRLIAEVKRASPSAGVIRDAFDPVEIATIYQAHGAAAISVLTDAPYFQGSLEYLQRIRATTGLPLLRKDFILDPYQLLEARAAGADAVLLISECLDPLSLKELLRQATDLGMTALVESYEADNVARAIDAGAVLLGINNRDLRTFEVDLQRTLRIRERVPRTHALVAESGIRSRCDVERLEAAGVDAMLVGERLMREEEIGRAVDTLLGRDT